MPCEQGHSGPQDRWPNNGLLTKTILCVLSICEKHTHKNEDMTETMCGPQSVKYLSVLLQKKFADLWLKDSFYPSKNPVRNTFIYLLICLNSQSLIYSSRQPFTHSSVLSSIHASNDTSMHPFTAPPFIHYSYVYPSIHLSWYSTPHLSIIHPSTQLTLSFLLGGTS